MQRIANLDQDHYVIWDTVFDAPITKILSYDEMKSYIESWEATDYDSTWKKKHFIFLLDNAKKWGVSTQLVKSDNPRDQVEELIANNRASEDEEELTLDEIIKQYSK